MPLDKHDLQSVTATSHSSVSDQSKDSETGKAKRTKSIKINVVDPNHSTEPKEVGGRAGLDPTRYGDWEKNGRCIDF